MDHHIISFNKRYPMSYTKPRTNYLMDNFFSPSGITPNPYIHQHRDTIIDIFNNDEHDSIAHNLGIIYNSSNQSYQ